MAKSNRDKINPRFGAYIREKRLQAGLSLRHVARLCDVTPSAIAYYEKGDMAFLPALSVLLGLSDAFDVPVGWLVDAAVPWQYRCVCNCKGDPEYDKVPVLDALPENLLIEPDHSRTERSPKTS